MYKTRASRLSRVIVFIKYFARIGIDNIKVIVPVFLWLAISATPSGAAIYKWVDENGVTQYSATPPPPGQEASTVHIAPSPSQAATAEAVRKLQERLADTRKRDAKIEETARLQSQQAAATREESLQRCRFARQNLYILEMQAPVFHVDDNGQRVYVNDQERASRIQDLKQQVASYCE